MPVRSNMVVESLNDLVTARLASFVVIVTGSVPTVALLVTLNACSSMMLLVSKKFLTMLKFKSSSLKIVTLSLVGRLAA